MQRKKNSVYEKKLTGLIRTFIVLALCFVIPLYLWHLTSGKISEQKLPTVFGFSQAVVLSGSMEPTFSVGDLLIIHKEDAYQCGEVITFSDGAYMTTHRIVEETADGFITRGDYNNTPDGEPVKPEQIKGRVVKIIPKLGKGLLFMKSPPGVIMILLAGLLLIFLPERLEYLLEKRKR